VSPAPAPASERYRTAVVTAIVLALAAGAFLDRGRTGTLTVAAAAAEDLRPDQAPAEAIARLIGFETGRAVALVPAGDIAAADADLVVLPALEFVRDHAGTHAALFAAGGKAASGADRAVLVARRGAAVDPSEVKAEDVLFQSPDRVNGCWQQLRWLVANGASLPVDPGALVFAPAPGRAERVVLAVTFGDRMLGACRLSDLHALWEAGTVRRDEVAVLFETAALPEWIVACKAKDRGHFERALSGLPSALQRAPAPVARTLRELGVVSFEPVAPSSLDALDALARFADTGRSPAGMP